MRRLLSLSLLLAVATPLAAQIERPIPYPVTLPDGWSEAVAAGTRTTTGEPGAKYWTNYARYAIKARLEPTTAKVTGHVEITYQNRSPNEIRRLQIHLRQNAHKAGNLRNRYLEITGGVTVSNLRIGDTAADEGASAPAARGRRGGGARSRVQGTVMTVTLPTPLAAGGEVKVAMDWEFQVPQSGAPRNGHDDFHTYYLGYWYPQVAVFEDVAGDFVAEQYLTNAEFYMGYADYDLAITVPQGYLVRATGELQNADEVLTGKARAALQQAKETRDVVHVVGEDDLAAGTQTAPSESGKLTWRFRAENVRDVAVSAARTYLWDATHAIVKDRDGPGRDGSAMIHAVYEPNSGD